MVQFDANYLNALSYNRIFLGEGGRPPQHLLVMRGFTLHTLPVDLNNTPKIHKWGSVKLNLKGGGGGGSEA